jgi:hypothetical protein
MARMRLLPTTAAAVSNPFSVHSGESLAVVASGLAGAETVVVQIYNGVDFVDLAESTATITATSLTTSISSVGLYRVRKSATVAASGVLVG